MTPPEDAKRNNCGGRTSGETNNEIKPLFDKVLISDLEKFCTELYSVHEILWQLYHNGRGPLIVENLSPEARPPEGIMMVIR